MRETTVARIGVIGGGVVGLAAAVKLARTGHEVTVFEPDADRRAASWGNAGHIATEQVAPLASPGTVRTAVRRLFALGGPLDLPLSQVGDWAPFAGRFLAAASPGRFRRGQAALGALLAPALDDWRDLADDIGRPDLVWADGHFVVWESAGSARRGRAAWAAAGTGRARFEDVTPADRLRLARTATEPLHGEIRFSGSGQISDLDALAVALETALAAAGGRILREAAGLEVEGGHAVIGNLPLDRVLVTAGVRSGALMAVAGHRAPIIAERGYHIRAGAPLWPADLPPVVFEDRSMIVTRYAECIQAAGFVEFGHADAPPDPRKWDRLEQHVRDLGLPIPGPFQRWMGARPTLPDYLPAIGRSDRVPNLYYAFGHQHLGLTLAATTARIVSALIDRAPPPVDVSPFSLSRFERSPRP